MRVVCASTITLAINYLCLHQPCCQGSFYCRKYDFTKAEWTSGIDDVFDDTLSFENVSECVLKCAESRCSTWMFDENTKQCVLLPQYEVHHITIPTDDNYVWSSIYSGENKQI